MHQNDKLFMGLALRLALHSKCVKRQVGCIITRNDSIISSGVNGTPPGTINCCDRFDREYYDREEHHQWSNIHELHAEVNAISKAHLNNISLNGSTFYVTLQPCMNCMKHIMSLGNVRRVVYYTPYHRSSEECLIHARNSGIIVEQFEGNL